MLEVEHPEHERAVHADLVAYGQSRSKPLHGDGHDTAPTLAADFVVTLLKMRLFSSPAAFLCTLEVHEETLRRGPAPAPPPTPRVLEQLVEDAGDDLDEERAGTGVRELTHEALRAAARAERSEPTGEERALLQRMLGYARRAAVTEDARTSRLLDWVQEQVKPNGAFTNERVIVFTEYRATQRYLQERLTDSAERERIKAQWQEPPGDFPVRVLLATEAASEGISLQRQCHRLSHAEIP